MHSEVRERMQLLHTPLLSRCASKTLLLYVQTISRQHTCLYSLSDHVSNKHTSLHAYELLESSIAALTVGVTLRFSQTANVCIRTVDTLIEHLPEQCQ
jgi:hypothetical protein